MCGEGLAEGELGAFDVECRERRTQVLSKDLAEFGEETGPCTEGTGQHHRALAVPQTYSSNFAIKRLEKKIVIHILSLSLFLV